MNPSVGASSFLSDIVRTSKVPGIQYAVVDSSGIVFEYYGGWADIEQQIPMTARTQLLAYSMTKTLTAAAILQFADRGKLALQDPANTYLDHNPYGMSVTIGQLLAHTSGIPNPNPLRWIHLASDRWDSLDEDAALRQVLQENNELDVRPGEKYAYSNINYWLLGKIIERVSGMTYKDYISRNIFEPLGITGEEMGFVLPPPPYRSKGYLARWSWMNFLKRFLIHDEIIGRYEEGGWLHIRGHYVNGSAYGGIVGTAGGFAKFLRDQLCAQSVLFSAKTKQMFFRQQNTTSGRTVPMTPGWHVGELNGERCYFKEGGGGGFHAEMRIYADRKIATVGMTNETSSNIKDAMNSLDPKFLHRYIETS